MAAHLAGASLPGPWWLPVRDGDPAACAMYRRHYSARRRPRNRKFVGPGQYLALMTADGRALFAWRRFIDGSGQEGVNCCVFRNEGPVLSSELILAAEPFAWHRWPGQRLYTYVNPRRVRSSNPGFCFLCAGWRRCGWTKGGLLILDKTPAPGHGPAAR